MNQDQKRKIMGIIILSIMFVAALYTISIITARSANSNESNFTDEIAELERLPIDNKAVDECRRKHVRYQMKFVEICQNVLDGYDWESCVMLDNDRFMDAYYNCEEGEK